MNVGLLFAILILFGFVMLFIGYLAAPKKKYNLSNKKRGPVFSPEKWLDVQAMISQGGPANYKQAIIDADKLVDAVLKSRVKGETMGERLKNARHLFSHDTYNDLWTAHKIRNKVAHEADFEGLSSEAKLAVFNFEKALKELKVI